MTVVERTSAGLQIVIPGCERRTLPKSTTRVDYNGQGLLTSTSHRAFATTRTASECTLNAETWAKDATERWLVRLVVGQALGLIELERNQGATL